MATGRVPTTANSPLTAKGDLFTYSTAPARLAVGNNGETIVADSSTSTGLRYQSNFSAGKNKIINGDMVIAQRGTSVAGITTDNTYNTVDRFLMRCVTIGTYTQSQETDAPAGFSKSLKVLCTTADAAPAASDRLAIVQKLEGDSVQDFAYGTASARTITLSFWVKSNVTGTFIAELFNSKSGTPKQVSNSYTISVANTWERKTIVIAGDTATAITAGNTEQFTLIFWLAAGSNFTSGTLQTAWAAEVGANRAVGQTNLAAAVNNSWQVTGVQIEIGNTATAFQTSTGTIQGELAACQRYYYLHASGGTYNPIGTGFYYDATNWLMTLNYPVTMRTSPTMISTSGTNYYGIERGGSPASPDYLNDLTANVLNENTARIYNNSQASGTIGYGGWIYIANASGSIAFNAEL